MVKNNKKTIIGTGLHIHIPVLSEKTDSCARGKIELYTCKVCGKILQQKIIR